ncbi:MAG: methylated-DNA--[protein]-cysteine S-methyltransferase [Planctomycetes bacterium]|nr:methylated-DNA--[protein]-cysteine S-methyltransferase [Planctomycetota bacterium]
MSATIFYHRIDSPIGALLLVSNGTALTGLYMLDHAGGPTPGAEWRADAGAFTTVCAQLAAYFAGELRRFDLPLAPAGTPFQQTVWRALGDIPYGTTLSYGELARRIGQPQASRAVGRANGQNPISIIVPCHRVIGANGTLTGYGGGIARKRWLLEHEGIEVKESPARERTIPLPFEFPETPAAQDGAVASREV